MKEIMAIFGKMPLKGFSKTRLAKDVGEELALKLYGAFIKDFSANLKSARAFDRYYIFGTPDTLDSREFFQREFNFNFMPQSDGPFFSRLAEVFRKIHQKEGPCFIHLTGTDIPDFPFDHLHPVIPKDDMVYIGPDTDGGFYYVAAPSASHKIFSFEENGSIFKSISRRAEILGFKVEHLKSWSDIDDLKGLLECLKRNSREKISHTAALWP